METDCSEQAYFLELHGLDIKGFAQVNTGALVSSTHYERDDSNWNPLFQLVGFGHAEKQVSHSWEKRWALYH